MKPLELVLLFLPLILTNVLHMMVVKKDLFVALKIPLWSEGFGGNKTLRGLVFVPVINALITLSFHTALATAWAIEDVFFYGFGLGLAYVLFELPNSWLKRRLGIKPGKKADKFRFFFIFLDRFDSAFGVILFHCLWLGTDLSSFFLLLFFAVMIHFLISSILVLTQIKKEL